MAAMGSRPSDVMGGGDQESVLSEPLNSTVVDGGVALDRVVHEPYLGSAIPNRRLMAHRTQAVPPSFDVDGGSGDSSRLRVHDSVGTTLQADTFLSPGPLSRPPDDSDTSGGGNGLMSISPGTQANSAAMLRKRQRLMMNQAKRTAMRLNRENRPGKAASKTHHQQTVKPPFAHQPQDSLAAGTSTASSTSRSVNTNSTTTKLPQPTIATQRQQQRTQSSVLSVIQTPIEAHRLASTTATGNSTRVKGRLPMPLMTSAVESTGSIDATYVVKKAVAGVKAPVEGVCPSDSAQLAKQKEKEAEAAMWEGQEQLLLYWVNQVVHMHSRAQLEAAEADLKGGEQYSRSMLMKLLKPPSGHAVPTSHAQLHSTTSSSSTAPGCTSMSLSHWAALRARAHTFYTSGAVSAVMANIQHGVRTRKAFVRPDRKMHADIGLQVRILSWFRAINPLWLRLGLETVFGEVIPGGDHRLLWRFVGSRLLMDPLVARKYGHKDVRGVMSDEGGKRVASLFLERTLRLLVFFDLAKKHALVRPDTRLFLTSSPFKSTQSVLSELIKCLVSAEGSLSKMLKQVGFVPSYEQCALEEYSYTVTNLASDLRNGVVLTKLASCLTASTTDLMKQLRYPAGDLARKSHNVGVAMKAFEDDGIDVQGVTVLDVVHAWRPPSFDLLWRIIEHYVGVSSVAVDTLQREVDVLRLAHHHPQQHVSAIAPLPLFANAPVLWQWLVACAQLVQMPVTAASVHDGRVLHAVLQYYRPDIVIAQTLQSTDAVDNMKRLRDACTSVASGGEQHESLTAVLEYCTSTVQQEPRVIPLITTVLCNALLPLGAQKRAVVVMQRAWRGYALRRDLHRNLRVLMAVVRVQRWFRGVKQDRVDRARAKAAVTIQRYWRRTGRFMLFWHKLRQLLVLHAHARRIQAVYRGWLGRREYVRVRAAVVLIQAFARMAVQRARYVRMQRAAVQLQAVWRSYVQLRLYQRQRAAVACLVKEYRAFKQRQYIGAVLKYVRELWQVRRVQRKAAVVLQSCVRAWLVRRSSCGEVVLMRERLVVAARLAVHQVPLSQKCTTALGELASGSMAVIHAALLTIERASSVSVLCCDELCAHETALPHICVLMQDMNRSGQVQKVLQICAAILGHLVKHTSSRHQVLTVHCADLLTVMPVVLLRTYAITGSSFTCLVRLLTVLAEEACFVVKMQAASDLCARLRHIDTKLSDLRTHHGAKAARSLGTRSVLTSASDTSVGSSGSCVTAVSSGGGSGARDWSERVAVLRRLMALVDRQHELGGVEDE